MDKLKETHYFSLPSQGNIYTMTHLQAANCPHKILVASLKRDIFCLEYQESAAGLIPTTKEVSFTYIPSGAEIISVDAFNKSDSKNEFVIGITIIKNSNLMDAFEFYLNIYSEWEENEDFNIDNIAQNCLNVELSFTPYQLTHTELIVWDGDTIASKEIVFLLSGSDNQVHVYREYTTDHLYKEVDNKEYFPEFIKTPSPVIWIDIHLNDDCTERLTAVACECGYVRLTKVCVKTNKLVFNFSTKLNNYISHLKIFPEEQSVATEVALNNLDTGVLTKKGALNLVVVNSILPPVLFEDVLTYGLSNYISLPRHDYTCVLTCCQIADVDFDGEQEILIGNSSEEIMVYKRDPDKGWCLEELKMFASPIISMKYVDLLEDGINELVVLSLRGVHFLQHDFSYVDEVLSEKIKSLNF
ncbi:hypothetical protein Zmor_019328 [Zophobas morio]|uniref:Kaptin n=1 Tax=Zophobas morio TaxID=2755281 RepID=A0AA38M8F7_9CUCU|nr:hypothetical protein Zmor_019328 [Zophobas morio]